MKIALISDIHGNKKSLEKALSDVKRNKVNQIFFLGDYITDSFHVNDILDIVKEYGDEVLLGNREKYIINYDDKRKNYNNYKPIAYVYKEISKNNLEYIKKMPTVRKIEINSYKILLLHGDEFIDLNKESGLLTSLDLLINTFDFDVCVFGHIHKFFYKKYKNRIFLSPGSIGAPTDTPFYKYCILDLGKKIEVSLKQFDVLSDYQELKKEYKNSLYYHQNKIWCNLLLTGIKEGQDFVTDFISDIERKKKSKSLSWEQYNLSWKQAYAYFLKNHNDIDYHQLYALFKENKINNIYLLFSFIQNQINYGFIDRKKKIYSTFNEPFYYLQSPIEVLQNKIGICFDVIELCRSFFKIIPLKFETYCLCYKNNLCHSIIVFYECNKVYLFDPFLGKESKIKDYSTLNELLIDVKNSYIRQNNLKDEKFCFYKYHSLKYGSTYSLIVEYIRNEEKIDLS